MNLRGISFHPVFDASGARNFDGSGWWYHRPLAPFGLDFSGSTFVSKTVTLNPRAGNLELSADGLTPKKRFPDCVVVNFRKGVALNAVGLSGPGAKKLFDQNIWVSWPEPFFVSFTPVSETVAERLDETKRFVEILDAHSKGFRAPFGLQINMSCPNIGKKDSDDFLSEAAAILKIANALQVPLMPKLSVTTPVQIGVEIARLPECDALCVSNTIPWGSFPDQISWRELFGSEESPLKKYGGGGLSGAALMPLVEKWVDDAVHKLGTSKPINAGGGILSAADVDRMKTAGASSIFIGSVAFLRGWRVKKIIQRAHDIFG